MVAGSGAAKFSGGGDVRKQGELRVECKYTDKDRYALTLQVLDQIRTQAIRGGLEAPVLQLSFGVGMGADVFAIFPGTEDYRTAIGWEIDKKQVTLKRDDLMVDLLSYDEIHLEFDRGDSIDIWTVRHWDDYLESIEEEEC